MNKIKVYYENGPLVVLEGKESTITHQGKDLGSEAAYIAHRRPQIEAEVKESGAYHPRADEEDIAIVTEAEVAEWAAQSKGAIRSVIAELFTNLPLPIKVEFASLGLYSEINKHLDDGRYDVVDEVFKYVVPNLSESAQKEFAENFAPLFEKLL